MEKIKRILRLLTPHKKLLITGSFFLLIATGTNLVFPWFIKQVIDTVTVEKNLELLNHFILLTGLLLILQLICTVCQDYYFNLAQKSSIIKLRVAVFEHLHTLSISYFIKKRTGDIVSRMTNDITTLENVITQIPATVLQQGVRMLGGIIIIIYMNWKLTIIAFLLSLVLVAFGRIVGMRLRGIATQAQDKLAQSTIVLEETISCIQVVKSFVQEKLEIARFAKIMDEILALSKRRIVITAIFVPTMGFIALLTALMLLWYGGREVISQEMSPGDLIAFILYSVIIAHPMGIFAQLFTHLQEGIGASERIFEILDTRPDIQESPNAKTLPPIAGKIEVENLCFQYQKEREVLKNISFTIEAGQEIALVGPSGAGKSTLIRLLHRFYDPTSGTIKVDGIPLKDVSLSSYFKQVGIVPQETILFGDTIEMNIRYAKSDATQTEIINAAKSANAHDFIMESPMQYQTIVGEKGIRLSAGQRQRIAIARAILKNPRLLILDEATSSLDNESEKLIQDALERLLKNRTSFIIAHRLSTIQNADKIIVLDQGKIVEIGNHKELMEKKGLYHHLTTVRLMDTKQPTTDNTGI